MIVTTTNYADWKLITNNAMTSAKVAFCSNGGWKAWSIDNSLLCVGNFGSAPASFATDFPTAASLNVPLSTPIG